MRNSTSTASSGLVRKSFAPAARARRLASADTSAVVEGSYRDLETPGGRYPSGTVVPVRRGSEVEELLHTGRPVRVDDHPPGSPVERLGDRCSVVAPVHVEDRLWGFLAATSRQVGGLPLDARTVTDDVVSQESARGAGLPACASSATQEAK